MENSSIKFLLGLYPKTETIEKKQFNLNKEFDEINQYAKSEQLARFEYLDRFINSAGFLERKDFYKNLTFLNSNEKKQEDEYRRLKKSHDIIFYYKFKDSSDYASFKQMEISKELVHFQELKAIIESPQFKQVKEYLNDKKKWEKTEEYRKINEYKELTNNPEFKNYFKFIGSRKYKDFVIHVQSNDMILFESRENYIKSQEFMSIKSTMKKKKFKTTEAYQKLIEYQNLKKDQTLQNYIYLCKSSLFQYYKKIHNSVELNHYNELQSFFRDPQLKIKEKEIKALRFNSSNEYKQLQEYTKLASSKPIKDYYKMKASKELTDFNKLDGSVLISDFENLEKYIHSDTFAKNKVYLLDKNKWKKSDEYKQYLEYQLLKKEPKIIWYFKLKDDPKFNILKAWKLVFEDDFAAGKLDRSKWITRYFWGEVLLNDTYALPDERHLFTDLKNIELNGSSVRILTKNEKVTGKVWNSDFGFFTKDFDYTSGIINTGSSFRTKYGRIEAKVKLNSTPGIVHAFWLIGDTKVPQIDIFKLYNNKLILSSFWNNTADPNEIGNEAVLLNGSHFTGKYLIYSLDWSPEKITWRINGIVVKIQTNNIPQELMYLTLNSGVLGETAGPFPAILEIDWVRVYQKN